MAINNILGSTGFVIVGEYSSSTEYNFLNVVTSNLNVFACRVRTGITNISPPTTAISSTNWFLLLEGISVADQEKLDFLTVTGAINLDDIKLDVAASKLKTDLITVGTAINLDNTTTAITSNTDALTVIDGNIPNDAAFTAASDGQVLTSDGSGSTVFRSTSGATVTQIENETSYETRRAGTGWKTGELFTPSTSFGIVDVVGSKAKMTITAGADTMAANSRVVFSAANAAKMFPRTTEPVPGLLAGFGVIIGTNAGLGLSDNEAWGTAVSTDSFIMFPAVGPDTTLAKATWLANIAASINGVTTNTIGAVSGNDVGTVTTNPLMYRLGVATVVGDTVEIETLVNASLGTLPNAAVGGNATYTYADGTADTYIAEFTLGYSYQRTASGGWFETALTDTILANAKI